MLATRQNTFLSALIHKDQVGFIPNRQPPRQYPEEIHLIHLLHQNKLQMPLSLVLHKAFNAISWDYLHYILQKWELDNGFLSWVKSLYSRPSASNKYLNQHCTPFPIDRGIRRGCPLSPIQFVLALEPLTHLVRVNSSIHGLSSGPHT